MRRPPNLKKIFNLLLTLLRYVIVRFFFNFLSFSEYLNLWSSAFQRRSQKFGAIYLKVLTLLSNVKTLRQIAPNFCVLLRKAELYYSELRFKKFCFKWFFKYEREVLKAIIFRKENGCLLSLSIGLDLIGLNQILLQKKFDQS